ncbi:MAG: hypothetical protein AABY45_07015, partial [Deltaproteobacteria bacterium]
NDAGIKLCVVDCKELHDKIASIKDNIPTLKYLFTFNHTNSEHWSKIWNDKSGWKFLVFTDNHYLRRCEGSDGVNLEAIRIGISAEI